MVFPLVSHPLYVDWCLVLNFTVNFHLIQLQSIKKVEKDIV